MAFATARSLALKGADGHVIDVQVDVSPGLVSTTIIGRVDKSLSEARDRVRMAINNDCGRWPAKACVGDRVDVAATIVRDGHETLRGVVRFRRSRARWREAPLESLGVRLSLPPKFEPMREQLVRRLTPLPDTRAEWR